MCVRQTEHVKLASVTENLIMCVAERMRPQHIDLWQREVSKLVSYAKSTAERGRLQNLDMWQKE